MQPAPPCVVPTHWWQTQASICATFPSPLRVAVRHVFCGFFFFLGLPVTLPFEIPKLPTDRHVRGFPTVWKLLHDSLLRTVSVLKSFVSDLSFIFCPTSFQRGWAAVLDA